MAFFQAPPALGNQFTATAPCGPTSRARFRPTCARAIEPELHEMGELAGRLLLRARARSTAATSRASCSGTRGATAIDRIELTPLWQEAARVAAEKGVVATAYERKHGALSRIHQFALVYLFDGSTERLHVPARDDRRRREDARRSTATASSSTARCRA